MFFKMWTKSKSRKTPSCVTHGVWGSAFNSLNSAWLFLLPSQITAFTWPPAFWMHSMHSLTCSCRKAEFKQAMGKIFVRKLGPPNMHDTIMPSTVLAKRWGSSTLFPPKSVHRGTASCASHILRPAWSHTFSGVPRLTWKLHLKMHHRRALQFLMWCESVSVLMAIENLAGVFHRGTWTLKNT